MNNTLTISIRPTSELMTDFRKAFRAAKSGRHYTRREGVYFTSIEAARNLLTPGRITLLRTIRSKRPASILELAKVSQRDFENVQEDLRVLERYGLVRLKRKRGRVTRKCHGSGGGLL